MTWHAPYSKLTLKRLLNTIKEESWFWIAKRLSGNDTNLTGAHQVGVYLPKSFFENVFPEIVTTEKYNPDSHIHQAFFGGRMPYVASNVRAIYYNNKFFPEKSANGRGTRNEFRLTGWGGRACPIQRQENTGSIWLAGFKKIRVNGKNEVCSVSWVAETINEEKIIESWLGKEIEPSFFYSSERVSRDDIENPVDIINNLPDKWSKTFPTGKEIVDYIVKRVPQGRKQTIDNLLLKRREIEFDLFAEIERLHLTPILNKGFDDVDSFINSANSITNRRKSRSGRSLELHLATIFKGANLSFKEQAKTELKKSPDFLFPGEKEYHQVPSDPNIKLYMLAAKTCCKERWRQILDEAKPEKIPVKHLFTLQNGVSVDQMIEMISSKVQLVVPEKYKTCFHSDYRLGLLNLHSFVEMIALSQNKEFAGVIQEGYLKNPCNPMNMSRSSGKF